MLQPISSSGLSRTVEGVFSKHLLVASSESLASSPSLHQLSTFIPIPIYCLARQSLVRPNPLSLRPSVGYRTSGTDFRCHPSCRIYYRRCVVETWPKEMNISSEYFLEDSVVIPIQGNHPSAPRLTTTLARKTRNIPRAQSVWTTTPAADRANSVYAKALVIDGPRMELELP